MARTIHGQAVRQLHQLGLAGNAWGDGGRSLIIRAHETRDKSTCF